MHDAAAVLAEPDPVAAPDPTPPLARIRALSWMIGARVPPSVQPDDLYAAGLLGWTEALRRYDPRHGVPFDAFAQRRIVGAMLDVLREGDPLSREQRAAVRRAEADGVRLVGIGAAGGVASDEPSPEDGAAHRQALVAMHRAAVDLPPKLARVFQLRAVEGLLLIDIAGRLGMTEARACQLVKQVAEALRDAMRPEL